MGTGNPRQMPSQTDPNFLHKPRIELRRKMEEDDQLILKNLNSIVCVFSSFLKIIRGIPHWFFVFHFRKRLKLSSSESRENENVVERRCCFLNFQLFSVSIHLQSFINSLELVKDEMLSEQIAYNLIVLINEVEQLIL